MVLLRDSALCVSLLVTTTVAEQVTVDDDGPADFQTIQDAVDYVLDGDEILVAPGVYTGRGENVVDLRGKAITLRAIDGPDVTVIDGGGERRGVICQSAESAQTVIDGFAIRSCRASWYDWNGNGSVDYWEYFGGGMWVRGGSSPTVRSCHFQGNAAEYGAGICNGDLNGVASNSTFIDCVFTENAAGDGVGGGLYNFSSMPTLIGCSFVGNSAYNGGGLLNWEGGNASLTECHFELNSAHSGGGIYNYSSMPSFIDCAFIENSADEGGGMFNADPSSSANVPILQRCVFIGNSATGEGGGIHNFSISPEIIECTISDNNAGSGGGVYSWNSSVPFFGNSLVCGNAPNQVGGTYSENDGNIIADSCPDDCFGDLTGDDIVGGADLTFVLGYWGRCVNPDDCPADLTEDGIVDGADITVVLAYWGLCP